ncbi:serine-rich adhesin for platelets-like [Hetaerina americana]|uniref:serine-rich adhesin for platelets-like n=1 Tax=Hetaerina americana TaxID=62018 RepID=UPI003A7F0F67
MIPKQSEMHPSGQGQRKVSFDLKQSSFGYENPANSRKTFNEEPAVSYKPHGTINTILDSENKVEPSSGSTAKDKKNDGITWESRMLEECLSNKGPRICLRRVDRPFKPSTIQAIKPSEAINSVTSTPAEQVQEVEQCRKNQEDPNSKKREMSPIPSTSTAEQLRADIETEKREISNEAGKDFEVLEVFRVSEGENPPFEMQKKNQKSKKCPSKESLPENVDGSGSDNDEWMPSLWYSADDYSSDSDSSGTVRLTKKKAKDKLGKRISGKKPDEVIAENVLAKDNQAMTSLTIGVESNVVSCPTSEETDSAVNHSSSSTIRASETPVHSDCSPLSHKLEMFSVPKTNEALQQESNSITSNNLNSQRTTVIKPAPRIKAIQPEPSTKPKQGPVPSDTMSADGQSIFHGNQKSGPTVITMKEPKNVPTSTAGATPLPNKDYEIKVYRYSTNQDVATILKMNASTNPDQARIQMPKKGTEVDVSRKNDVLTELRQGNAVESSTSGLIKSKASPYDCSVAVGSGEGVSTAVGTMSGNPVRLQIIPASSVLRPIQFRNSEAVIKTIPNGGNDLRVNDVQTSGSNVTVVIPGPYGTDVNEKTVEPNSSGTGSVHGKQRISVLKDTRAVNSENSESVLRASCTNQQTTRLSVSSGTTAANKNIGMTFSLPGIVNIPSSLVPGTIPALSTVQTITNLANRNQYILYHKATNPVPRNVPIQQFSTAVQPGEATVSTHSGTPANDPKIMLLQPVPNINMAQPENAVQVASVPKPVTYMFINSAGDGSNIQWQATGNQTRVIQNLMNPQTSSNVTKLNQMPLEKVQQKSTNSTNSKESGHSIIASSSVNGIAMENRLAAQNLCWIVTGNEVTPRAGLADSSNKTASTSRTNHGVETEPNVSSIMVSGEPISPPTETGSVGSSRNEQEPRPTVNFPQENKIHKTYPSATIFKAKTSSPGAFTEKQLVFKFHSMQGAKPGVVPKDFMIKCRWCKDTFTDPEILTSHMSKVHNKELSKVLEQAKAANLNKAVPDPVQEKRQAPEQSAPPSKDNVKAPELITLSDDEEVTPKRSLSPHGQFKCKYCPEISNCRSSYKEHRKVFHSSKGLKRRKTSRGKEEDSNATQPKRQVQTVPPFYVSPRSVYMNTPVGKELPKSSTSKEHSQTIGKVLDVITISDNNSKPTITNTSPSTSEEASRSVRNDRVDSPAGISVSKATRADPVDSKKSETIKKVDETELCGLAVEKQKDTVRKGLVSSPDVAEKLTEENLIDAMVSGAVKPDSVKAVDNLTSTKPGSMRGQSNKSLNLNDSIPSTSKSSYLSDIVILNEANMVRKSAEQDKDRDVDLSDTTECASSSLRSKLSGEQVNGKKLNSNDNTAFSSSANASKPTREPVKDKGFNLSDHTATKSSKTSTESTTEQCKDALLSNSNDTTGLSSQFRATKPSTELVKDAALKSIDLKATSGSTASTVPSTELVKGALLNSVDSATKSCGLTSKSSDSTAISSTNVKSVQPNNACSTGFEQWECDLVDQNIAIINCPICPLKFSSLSLTWRHLFDCHNLPEDKISTDRTVKIGNLQKRPPGELKEQIKCFCCVAKFSSILACADHFREVHLPKL